MWQIYSYGGGDFLAQIFNGIAALFGDANYYVALKITATLGLLGVLITAAFEKGKLNLHWILAVTAIFLIAIVPKKTITIVDKVNPSNTAVVDNVPLGIAAISSIFSNLSDYLTKSFEVVFSLPTQMQYRGNGLLFAQSLVEESTRFEITSPRTSANFSEFWKSCVYYDLLLGLYSWEQLLKSTDLINYLKTNTSKVRSFSYQHPDNKFAITVCREGFNQLLIADLNQEITPSNFIYANRLLANQKDKGQIVARFAAAMPVAYGYLTGITQTNTQILSQNLLANSFKRGLINFASNVDAAAAAADFTMAKAEAERQTTFNVMGRIAKKKLPILQSIFEAFIYGVFPIVMLMAMLPVAGKVLVGYARALAWINLWPPLYAILHFALSYYGQQQGQAAVNVGTGSALSMMTNTGLGNILSDYAAIAGYLSLSIPMISWMIISASGSMVASLAGRVVESYAGPVGKAADEVSSGNISLGQMQYANTTSFQNNSAPAIKEGTFSTTSSDGVMATTTDKGNFYQAPLSSLPFDVNFGQMMSNSVRSSLSKAQEQAESNGTEFINSISNLNASKNAALESWQQTKSTSESWNNQETSSLGYATTHTENYINDLAKLTGVDSRKIKALEESIFTTASGGIGIPNLIKQLSGSKAEISIGGSIRQNWSQADLTNTNFNQVLKGLISEDYAKAQRQDAAAIHSVLGNSGNQHLESKASEITSALNQQESASSSLQNSLRSLQAHTQSAEKIEQLSASLHEKGNDGFLNWATTSKGFSENTIRGMISDYMRGNTFAKSSFNDLTQEYINEQYQQMLTPNHQLNLNPFASAKDLQHQYQGNQEKIANSFTPHNIENNQKSIEKIIKKNEQNFGEPEFKFQENSEPPFANRQRLIQAQREKLKAEYKNKEDSL